MTFDPIPMKRWTARKTKVVTEDGVQVVNMQVEVRKIFSEITKQEYYELRLWFNPAVQFPGFPAAAHEHKFDLSLDTDEIINMSFEEFNKIARVLVVAKYQIKDLIINPRAVRRMEVKKEWVIPSASVSTHVGIQTTNLRCMLKKIYFDDDDHTLFERKILKYRSYRHMIVVTPDNRDKDYLPGFSAEGNDAVHSFTLGVEENERVVETDFSEQRLNSLVFERLKNFGSSSRKVGKVKEPWTRQFFQKDFGSWRIGLFSAIYPFHGDHLSGWTSLFEIEVNNDNEHGLRLTLALLGFHLWISSYWLYKLTYKWFVRNRPFWDRENESWDSYYRRLNQWEKDYPREAFWDTQWSYELSITRANGIRFKCEYDHSYNPRWGFHFNPLRNKLWNLI